MAELILAIDQGTTGTTVLLIDSRGRVKARAYQEIRQFYPQPGWVEHDPEEIYRSAVTLSKKALRAARARRGRRPRDRVDESARDLRGVGARQRPAGPSRDRVAMPAQREYLRGAA